MPAKNSRFTRKSFPSERPDSRRSFSWGSISFFKSNTARVAAVISKKTLKKAHDRNRAKRRALSALPTALPQKGIIMHLRREALTTNFNEMRRDLGEVLGTGV